MQQYSNKEEILKSTTKLDAERILEVDKELLTSTTYAITSLPETARDNFELHVYTPDGTYLTGDHKLPIRVSNNFSDGSTPAYNVEIDLKKELNTLNIFRGQYKIIVNFFDSVLGNFDIKNIWIKEISSTRQEIKLTLPKTFISYLQQLNDLNYKAHLDGHASSLILNFSKNITYPVLNFRLENKYDLTNIRKFTTPPTIATDLESIKSYAINNLPPGTLIRDINNPSDFYIIESGKKRKIESESLLFELAKILDAIRFNSEGEEIRVVYPTLTLDSNNIIVPNLIDVDFSTTENNDVNDPNGQSTAAERNIRVQIPDGPNFTLIDFIGLSDYVNIVIKLYAPLEDTIVEKTPAFISYEYRDPYTDTVFLVDKSTPIEYNQLRPANFSVDAYEKQSIPTEYKTWNDLLTTNLSTSQQILDKYFSGSLQGVELNINYGDFSNFVHFSSATERVKNFKYKLELIEYYSDKIKSLSGSINTNLTPLYEKRNAIVGSFDNFEKYLFLESGSLRLYTHVSYSINPWPKRNVSYNQYDPYTYITSLYRTTQSIAIDYYNDLLEQAEVYDFNNIHRLLKAVPIHIRADDGNDDFNLFVDMLGHHYDIIWSYINHMSDIYSREEHPKDGMANDLLYHVAKSMGFQLYNGRSTTDLWRYALGYNSSGSRASNGTNNIISLPDDQITKEQWRRIVNNLPYLLKTKGTERSVKALLSCFGMPSTILTIKEYGGPSTYTSDTHYPEYVHEKFAYAYKVNSGYGTSTARNNFLQLIPSKTTTKFSKNVNAIEFRFKTDDEETYTPGVEYNIFSYHNVFNNNSSYYWNGNNTLAATASITIKKDTNTNTDGTITLRMGSFSETITNVNVFDNEFNLLYLEQIGSNTSLKYRKAKYGKIVETGSTANIASTIIFSDINNAGSIGGMAAIRWGHPSTVTVGGSTLYPFTGYIQEIRLWSGSLNTASLEEHTLSPNTYTYNVNRNLLTGDEALEPYNRLVQRYPLSSKKVYELYATIQTPNTPASITSSYQLSIHPDQTIDAYKLEDFSNNQLGGGIWLVNISGSNLIDEVLNGFEETYYTPSPSLGGNSLYTNKVRIEENSLTGYLSPKKRVEQSSYDKYSIDSAKLGIFFSPQTYINEDIFNQLGYFEIDDFIGDPSNLYKNNYPEYEDFSRDYWRKFSSKYNYETFFRALSVYDTTIFKYIKDMMPYRSNTITGFLIEPNVLERKRFGTPKASAPESLAQNNNSSTEQVIDAQPVFDNNLNTSIVYPTYETLLDNAPNIGGEYPIQLDVTMNIPPTPGGEYPCYVGTITTIDGIDLDRLGPTWTENRPVGQYTITTVVSASAVGAGVTPPILESRGTITGSSAVLNSFSASIYQAWQYIDANQSGNAQIGQGAGRLVPSGSNPY